MSPASPSGSKPSFVKPETKSKNKKPGRKEGHKGTTRKKPNDNEINKTEEHKLNNCPICETKLEKKPKSKRERIIIDIELPEDAETTQHVIYQYWCSKCKQMIESVVTDALPGFTIGINTIVYSAILHYCQGMSISNIVKNLKVHGMKLSSGSLIGQWYALAEILKPYYKEIQAKIRGSTEAVYADETGFRQKGKKFWIWTFSTKEESFFTIRKSRGSDVVLDVLGKVFHGILVTDFWKPYLAVKSALRQWCIAHFLREFKKIEFRRKELPKEYHDFKKKTKRLFNDALRESKVEWSTTDKRENAHKRFVKRLDSIVAKEYSDSDVNRLVKRLKKYRDGFFTFVIKNVDATNNHAERIIRFAVILRKISFHTMSDKGSETMSILISVFKTLELQGYDVFHETLSRVKKEMITNKYKKNEKNDSAA